MPFHFNIKIPATLTEYFLGVSPDKQTPRRGKLLSGSGGNGGQQEESLSAGETTLEELAKAMEEKLSNSGMY